MRDSIDKNCAEAVKKLECWTSRAYIQQIYGKLENKDSLSV